MIDMTPLILRACLYERFDYAVQAEREKYTQHIQAERDKQIEECRVLFMDLVNERRVTTDVLPIPVEYLKDAQTLIQRAIQTRQLENLEDI